MPGIPTPTLVFCGNDLEQKDWMGRRTKRVEFEVHFEKNDENERILDAHFAEPNDIYSFFVRQYLDETAKGMVSLDPLYAARAAMKSLYDLAGLAVPSYFPDIPVEKKFDIGRTAPVGSSTLACACVAKVAEARTDWAQIAALYGELYRIQPTAVVALNRAVAVAMAGVPDDGLRLLDDDSLEAELGGYHLYHAARADLLRRAGRFNEAATAYEQALKLTNNAVERAYLESRVREVRRR